MVDLKVGKKFRGFNLAGFGGLAQKLFQKEEEKPTRYERSYATGLADAATTIAKMPAYANAAINYPHNKAAQVLNALGFDTEYKSTPKYLQDNPITRFFEEASHANNYLTEAYGVTRDMIDKYTKENPEATDDDVEKFVRENSYDAVKLIGEKRYGEAADYLLNATIQNAPYAMATTAMMSAGAPPSAILASTAIYGASSAMSEMQGQERIDLASEAEVATIQGLVEGLSERMFSLPVFNYVSDLFKSTGAKTASAILKNSLKAAFASFGTEAAEEYSASIVNDLVAQYYGLEDQMTMREINDRAMNEGLIGGFSGLVIGNPAGIMTGLSQRLEQSADQNLETLTAEEGLRLSQGTEYEDAFRGEMQEARAKSEKTLPLRKELVSIVEAIKMASEGVKDADGNMVETPVTLAAEHLKLKQLAEQMLENGMFSEPGAINFQENIAPKITQEITESVEQPLDIPEKKPIMEKIADEKIAKPKPAKEFVSTEEAIAYGEEIMGKADQIEAMEAEGREMDAYIKELKKLPRTKENEARIKKVSELHAQYRKSIKVAKGIGEVVPAEKEGSTEAMSDHIEYLSTRQLPKGSKLKSIMNEIRVLKMKRTKGQIDAGEATARISELNKRLIETADKEGVSLRATKGGDIRVAVREAGTYVPVEFSEYKKFKDVDTVLGGSKDVTRMIQEMDGALTLKEKAKEPGQAGPIERNVLWPTRDMVRQKIQYIKENIAKLRKIFSGVKKGSKKDKQITNVLREINTADSVLPAEELLAREEIRAITSDPVIVQKTIDLRRFYDSMINDQNIAREMRNQDPIPYRKNYSPEILRDATIWERLMNVGTDAKKALGEKTNLPDYIQPNKPFNPREMANKHGIKYEDQVQSAMDLAERYIGSASKDIFNTSIIQNNKAFIQQLETMGYQKSAQSLADWTAEAYAGIAPRIDRAVNLPRGWQKGMRYFNRLRNMAVFPFNFAWNLATQTSSLALTATRYGIGNTIKGITNYMTKADVRDRMAREHYSYIVKTFKAGKMSRQDVKNLIGEDVKIYKNAGEVVEDFAHLVSDSLEKFLTGVSIEAARIQGKKRGLTGKALEEYASDGGAKTQSMYNDEDKPGILRNLTIKTAYPYQTFGYEVMNTLKEWAGKTGTPPATQTERALQVVRFTIGVSLFNLLSHMVRKKEVWDWTRPPLPFAELWFSPIIKKIKGEYYDPKRTLPSPIQFTAEFAEGMDRVLERGDWRKLRNWMLKYLPGVMNIPGGVQIQRIVDGIIAYAEGGVYDKSGKKMFEVTDEDLPISLLSGVWATPGGQAYLKKREKPLLDVEDWDTIFENIEGKTPRERKLAARKKRLRAKLRREDKEEDEG